MKKNIIQRIQSFFIPQKRAKYSDYVNYSVLGNIDESGEVVSSERGTKLSIIFSCINVLAQDVSKLPFNVKQNTNEGKKIIKSNPVYKLIHSAPNNYTNAFNFWYSMLWEVLSTGNGYAIIKKDGQLNPEALYQIPAQEVKPVLIDNEVYYEYNEVLISSGDILHLKMYSFDGVQGVSPIIHNASTIGLRIKQDKYKARIIGSKPSGILTFSQDLNPDQVDQNREAWRKMTRDDIAGTPVLSGGAKYQPFSFDADKTQMVEAAEMSDEHIMGIFRVPPTLVQNYRRATFSNAEQQGLVYVNALTPILTMIEQECNTKLFRETNKISNTPLYTKFNIEGLLRGDILTQVEYFRFMVTNGIMSPDEIRAIQDLPPLPDGLGNTYMVQGAMISMEQLKNGAEHTTEQKSAIGFKELAEREKIYNKK